MKIESITKYPNLAKLVFEKLDNKTLGNCRKVSKSWHNCIENDHTSWIQIVKIPRILKNGLTHLHLAAIRGQILIFNNIFEREKSKNPTNFNGITPFHFACFFGQIKIVQSIIQKSIEFNFSTNSEDKWGWTGFHLACSSGHLKIAEMLMKNSSELDIDVKAKGIYNRLVELLFLSVVLCNIFT